MARTVLILQEIAMSGIYPLVSINVSINFQAFTLLFHTKVEYIILLYFILYYIYYIVVWRVPRFELVKSMLPAEHHKVLTNIRKAEARTKRRKEASEEQEDSDSEAEAPKPKAER